MEIKGDDYVVRYDAAMDKVSFQGLLRLNGMVEYRPVMELLLKAIEQTTTVTIDLQELEFLNSSGISMLSMFVVKARDKGDVQLILQGSNKILWQTKSLKNLQRLLPSLRLELI